MSHLYRPLGPQSDYVDRRSGYDRAAWAKQLQKSKTIYVGNLSFYTTEDQVYELFSKCGEIDVVVMGLNRKKKCPCGFCFVRFHSHAAANRAVEFMNGVRFDERPIRVDWDSGDGITEESRKFGRGINGLQWRDEFRKSFDAGRGGEGGGVDYASFVAGRGKRKRFQPERQWDRYGHPTRNVRPRHIPPPPQDGNMPLKPDVAQPQTEDIKLSITPNHPMEIEGSLKPEDIIE